LLLDNSNLAAVMLSLLKQPFIACFHGRYPKYNVVAKKLYRRLEALGAQLLLPVGAGGALGPSG
jgi:hypothetical protein